MVSTLFRDPQALSSALTALRTLQHQAFGPLNPVETLDSAANYYPILAHTIHLTCTCTCTHLIKNRLK